MNKTLNDALVALITLDRTLKPVQLADARESALIQGLNGLAAEYGREIEPTRIDANGEMNFFMKGSAEGRGQPYGPELAAWLSTIATRTGTDPKKGPTEPGSNWCRIHHFEVERLLLAVGRELSPAPIKYDPAAKAPISSGERKQLERDAENIPATAKRKDVTCEAQDLADEIPAARDHFELGCWLYYYSKRVGANDGLQDRIDCARRLFDAGIQNPGYRFFTVFEFGERQFDTLFEMGDSDQVVSALRDIALADPTGGVARAFPEMGWSLVASPKRPDADVTMAP